MRGEKEKKRPDEKERHRPAVEVGREKVAPSVGPRKEKKSAWGWTGASRSSVRDKRQGEVLMLL